MNLLHALEGWEREPLGKTAGVGVRIALGLGGVRLEGWVLALPEGRVVMMSMNSSMARRTRFRRP